MAKNKEAESKLKDGIDSDNFITIYCHFIYKFIGRKLIKRPKFSKFFYESIYNKKYEGILKKANLKLLPEEYFMGIYITLVTTLATVVLLTIAFLIAGSALSVIAFFGGVGALVGIGILFYNYPVVLARTRGQEIDAAIPYLLPYMKILAKEISLAKMVEILDNFLIYKEIKVEFTKIKYYSGFIGYDIQSSIREAMLSCPSRQLSDLMNDLVTISNSGGDIYAYLDRKLYNLQLEIEAVEAKNIDTLLIFSQIYVVLLLIAPLFFTIMSAILNLVQFSAESSSSETSAVFLIFMLLLALPFIYAGFMMLIYYTKPLYSRLKPMKNERFN